MEKKALYHGVKDGDTFEVGGIEFIKFPAVDGKVPAVAKDVVLYSSFGSNNNLAESKILKRLEEEVLPKILETVGDENVCRFKTDLTTWDGLKTYGEMESKISLPTMDFYRNNVDIFDSQKPDTWWWLATADSAAPHWKDDPFALCVSPLGLVDFSRYDFDFHGVRPFCIFESSIFGSCEE